MEGNHFILLKKYFTPALIKNKSTMATYHSDKFKEFYQSWIKKVISVSIAPKQTDDGLEKVSLDNISIIEFLFQTNNLPHKA